MIGVVADEQTLAEVERAMTQLRRSMTRRMLARLAARDSGQAIDPAVTDVLDAVDEGRSRGDQEVTVGLVAERLGIDPSRASRMVAAAISAGYLRRVASQADGRRIQLELTPAAEELTAEAHRSRQQLYERLMEGWSLAEQAVFAKLIARFAESLTEFRTQES